MDHLNLLTVRGGKCGPDNMPPFGENKSTCGCNVSEPRLFPGLSSSFNALLHQTNSTFCRTAADGQVLLIEGRITHLVFAIAYVTQCCCYGVTLTLFSACGQLPGTAKQAGPNAINGVVIV